MTIDEQVQSISTRKGLVFAPDNTKPTRPTLTPVGMEKAVEQAVQIAKAVIPLDVPSVLLAREGVADVAADLRKQAAFLISVADGLDVMTGVPSAVKENLAERQRVEVKLREQQADRQHGKLSDEDQAAFEARMRTLSEAAQASVHKGDVREAAAEIFAEDLPSGSPIPGWTCPTHGPASLVTLTSRKGRVYNSCTAAGCGNFEKEVPHA